ncbi:MAG TPA: small-conductance mechanosensitive channel [Ruminococcus sp.]|nr:small-conductance mechanosensitive channel [Ruminococcus sp.]
MNTGDAIQEQVERASSLLTDTAEHIRKAFPSIIAAILLLAAGMLIVRLITRIIGKATDRSKIDGAAKNFLISVIRVFLYVIVIVMALSVLNVPMSSILTVLGAAGLAVSLALQNCLTNLCGGFIILFSKPFSAGDTVELDGTIGNVSSIGILYTKLKTLDGKTVYIPNGKITDAKIINFTADPARRIDLTFNIAYSADFASARRIIMDVIKENKLLLSSPEPVVRMSSLNENSVTVDVLVWTANDNYFTARYDLTEGVKAAFDREGIEIPFRQLDVHLKND